MRSKRTPLLLAAVAVLLAANIWWFTRAPAEHEPDFVLAARTEGVRLPGAAIAQVPAYDTRNDGWTVQGKTAASLNGYLRRDNDRALEPYLPVALSPHASTQDFRAMLASLVDRGICSFALVQATGDRQEIAATVQHIVSVRDARGANKSCKVSDAS
ncbi:hypothetical protein [Novosphingobium gossypii]|uniref:hypothetical protein n=1 Tax=Novosphingobium gossypii TaxID=1604774 RepID=UPI003D262121